MRIQLTSVLAAIIATITLSSCGKKDEKSAVNITLLPADPFLAPAELAKGSKVNPLSKTEAEAKIKSEKDLYDDGNPSLVQLKKEDCITSIMNSIPLKSYGSYIGMGAEADITGCAQESFGPEVTAAPSTLRIAFQWGCDNQDFSSFDGKTYGELSQSEEAVCTTATKINSLLHVRMILAAKRGSDFDYEKRLFMGKATATGQPCTSAVDGTVLKHADGCFFTNRDVNSIYKVSGASKPEEGFEDFSQLETSNLVSANGSTNVWFQSGKMKAILNNWTGEVTYSSATTAPTYSISNGPDTATGTIGSTKSVSGTTGLKDIARAVARSISAATDNSR